MSYRPITAVWPLDDDGQLMDVGTTDVWILARTKLKKDSMGNKQSYHGAFPAGFLHRARQLLGVRRSDPVLHVCGGMVRECLYRGFEENDRTLDLDPETKPDYLMDAKRLGVEKGDLFPVPNTGGTIADITGNFAMAPGYQGPLWPAMMIDRPYTSADHAEYDVPPDAFPSDINDLLKRALMSVEPGGRVGVLDYIWPSPPTKLGKEVAVIAVGTGRNNRARWFTVFERLAHDAPADDTSDVEGGEAASEPPKPTTVEPTPPSTPTPTPSRRRRRKAKPDVDVPCGCDPEVNYQCEEHAPPDCVACGGSGKNSKGGPCVPCQNRQGLAKAAVAHVCHGCKEGFLLDGEGMERVEPLTDLLNPWHRACWEQKQRKAEEAARKNQEERDRAEARAKGWPICPTCARAITPDQKNVDGRHYACGNPKPQARRRRKTSSMEAGFDA